MLHPQEGADLSWCHPEAEQRPLGSGAPQAEVLSFLYRKAPV